MSLGISSAVRLSIGYPPRNKLLATLRELCSYANVLSAQIYDLCSRLTTCKPIKICFPFISLNLAFLSSIDQPPGLGLNEVHPKGVGILPQITHEW